MTSGKKYWSDGTPVAGQQFEYGFDDIGNRKSTKSGGDQSGAGLRPASYSVNNLNQYTSRDVPGYVTVLGSANSNATVTVNLQRAYRYGNYFQDELGVNNSSSALWFSLTNLAVLNNGTNADIVATNTGNIFLPMTPETFGYDLDGNLTNSGRWTVTWDAENRATSFASLISAPSASMKKVDCAYDFQGRRIQKIVSTNNGSAWIPVSTNRFVYDGWNLVAILDSQSSILASFQWGNDLSGSLQGAGGVGGLISMTVYAGTNAGAYFHSFDGNGNVAALVNAANGAMAAQYEYDPFLGITRASGALAFVNPFLGSTKFFDAETGLYYYGYRFYDPSAGRWPNRDPLEESGGINLYGFIGNAPENGVDWLGAALNSPPGGNEFDQWPYAQIPPNLGVTYSAGPDITEALKATLKQVDKDFWAHPDRQCKACDMLNFPGPTLTTDVTGALGSWDIQPLKDMGQSGQPLAGGKAGTGDWVRTVQFRYRSGKSKVYWGGAVNYALWGRANELCYARFHATAFSLERALWLFT